MSFESSANLKLRCQCPYGGWVGGDFISKPMATQNCSVDLDSCGCIRLCQSSPTMDRYQENLVSIMVIFLMQIETTTQRTGMKSEPSAILILCFFHIVELYL